MNVYVLDASVAAKWFLPARGEPLAVEAIQLMEMYAKGDIEFVVPDLFWCEFANVLWKAARQGRWTERDAEKALSSLSDHKLRTVPAIKVLNEALLLAFAFDRSVYDCIYIALAASSNCNFLTADERLVTSVSAHLPVKWLGAGGTWE